ncbi:hypothetical protein DPMN_152867 [Dreissena polymorpha]|uniref:Peptidase S8/S53 domain-containing protein n=1 Tax=Dreissena polymorpha TaxID=45954 RepID=A0A9D4FJP4_DREPO|nr:hypothetical protein DPMN_152867 [Dreissena polymorpha]
MGVQNAWQKGFSGSGITIAIVDDGIDTSHSDFKYDASLSYNFIHDIADPNHVLEEDGKNPDCNLSPGLILMIVRYWAMGTFSLLINEYNRFNTPMRNEQPYCQYKVKTPIP